MVQKAVAVTRSRAAERAQEDRPLLEVARQPDQVLWLIAASILIAAGLFLIYLAKSRDFKQIESAINSKQILDLNKLSAREELLPYLSVFADLAERQFAARKIYYASGSLPNVGAIARI